MQFLTNQK